jgi:hypothetical protein
MIINYQVNFENLSHNTSISIDIFMLKCSDAIVILCFMVGVMSTGHKRPEDIY